MSALEEKLRSEVQQTTWNALAAHAERGGLILVDARVDLLVVALAVAQDRLADVQTFLHAGLLKKPGETELAALNLAGDERFHFVIVQPFVLAKLVREEPVELN